MSKEIWTSVIQILKIITPAVIESHILIRKNKEVVVVQEEKVEFAQAVGAENFSSSDNENSPLISEVKEEQTAQIIPLRPNDISKEHIVENIDLEIQTSDESQDDLEALDILGVKKQKALEEKAKLIEKQKQESTSVFILNQRTKLRESKKKLIGQSAMKHYKKEMSGEHLQERSLGDLDDNLEAQALSTSSASGILVNKKQA